MAQFDVRTSRDDGQTLLVDLQDDMLESLSTRIAAPLASPQVFGLPMKTVNPRLFLHGREYILLAHLLAAIPATMLGEYVGTVAGQRSEVVSALDMLFTGI